MTRNLFLACATLSLALFSAGCAKSSNPTSSNDTGTTNGFGTMTCKVDGTDWSAGGYSSDPTSNSYQYQSTLRLVGYKQYNNGNTVDQLTLSTTHFHGAGTYPMTDQMHIINDPSAIVALGLFVTTGGQNNANNYYSDSTATNTLVITSWDSTTRHIAGTFQFHSQSVVGSKTITNGTFDLKIPS